MKQKKTCFLLSLLFCVFGCKGETNSYPSDKVLLKKSEGINSLYNIQSVNELDNITRYEDCVIFASLIGCGHCENEREKLQQYIFENETVIYEVTRDIYALAYESESNSIGSYAYHYPRLTGYPDYLFYKNGKLIQVHVGELGKDYNDFKRQFEQYSSPINLYCLNDYRRGTFDSIPCYFYSSASDEKESYDQTSLGFSTLLLDKKKKEAKSTILFTYRRCKDCASYKENVLYETLCQNPEKKIYYYEVEGYYLLKNSAQWKEEGLKKWADFSLKYGLIDEDYFHVDSLSQKAGVVPTIVTYKEDSFLSKDVFLNEEGYKYNKDSTISYEKAFHKECLSLSSSTKVKKEDSSSSDFQKAVKELSSQALQIDIKASKEYLENNL